MIKISARDLALFIGLAIMVHGAYLVAPAFAEIIVSVAIIYAAINLDFEFTKPATIANPPSEVTNGDS